MFGATGDLTPRRLLPALHDRLRDRQIPAGSRIAAAARWALSDEGWRERDGRALRDHVPAGCTSAPPASTPASRRP